MVEKKKKDNTISFYNLAPPETWPKTLSLKVWLTYWYPKICNALGINAKKDEEIVKWVEDNYEPTSNINEVKKKIRKKSALVMAPSNPVLTLEMKDILNDLLIIATEPVIGFLNSNGIIPQIIETDLDSNFNDLIHSAKQGSILAIHVHGDNKERIKAFFEIPETKNIKYFFTTQTRPSVKVVNTLGFTDGDRGVFLAQFLGCEQILLSGFELDTKPVTKQIHLSNYNEWLIKKKIKLEIAKALICWLSNFQPIIDLNNNTKWASVCNILQ